MDWPRLVVGLDRDDREKITELATQVERFRGDSPPPWPGPDGLAQMLARLAITAVRVLPELALEWARESLALYAGLAATRPDEFDEELRYVWYVLGTCFTALGRHEEALAAAREEQVAALRVAAIDPDEDDDAASVSGTIARCLVRLGRAEEALVVAAERVERARPAGRSELIDALYHQAQLLDGAGRTDEAIVATSAAVEVGRRLVAGKPDLYEDQLIRDLYALRNRLTAVDRPDDALAAMAELVEVSQAWARAVPLRRGLAAASLRAYALQLARHDRPADGVAAAAEAVRVCRAAELGPSELARAADALGSVLSSAGRHVEALAACDEALALYRQLHATDPAEYAPLLADAYRGRAAIYRRLRHTAQRSRPARGRAESRDAGL